MTTHRRQVILAHFLWGCLFVSICLPLTIAAQVAEAGDQSEVQNLIEQLKNPDPIERSSAADALWRMGTEAKATTPALIEALKDQDRQVRGLAGNALGGMGTEARAAIPALIEALQDQHADVRRFAALALGKMGTEAQTAVPTPTEPLKDPHEIMGQVTTRSSVTDSATEDLAQGKQV